MSNNAGGGVGSTICCRISGNRLGFLIGAVNENDDIHINRKYIYVGYYKDEQLWQLFQHFILFYLIMISFCSFFLRMQVKG